MQGSFLTYMALWRLFPDVKDSFGTISICIGLFWDHFHVDRALWRLFPYTQDSFLFDDYFHMYIYRALFYFCVYRALLFIGIEQCKRTLYILK